MIDPLFSTILLAIVLGVMLSVFAHRFKIPVVAPLLIAGILLGPSFAGVLQPGAMGEGLAVLTRVGVAIILFDGGLSLRLEDFRTAPYLIRRLLTLGILTTWMIIASAIYLLFSFTPGASLLAASLVVVTGPTVIMPILRRVRVEEKLHNALLWEGILIDPLGVFLATLCFELLVGSGGGITAFALFGVRISIGVAVGLAGGFIAVQALKRRWIPEELTNLFTLSIALLVFFACESVAHESGLLGVLAAGFYIARRQPPGFADIHKFKAEISTLLIAVLFLLLSANLDLSRIFEFGWRGLVLLVIVLLVARPVSIAIASYGGDLNLRQKAFLSWVAPRGIVAASMASLFALAVRDENPRLALFLELFTFSVIGATVLLQGLSAGWVAKLLHVDLPHPHRWLIVGGHKLGRGIAQYLDNAGLGPTLIVDSNRQNIQEAQREGLMALNADATNPKILDYDLTTGIGHILALTDNENVNALSCNLWHDLLGHDHLHRWVENVVEDDSRSGMPVWPGLPLPSLLSSKLEHGIVQISGLEGSETAAENMNKGYWNEKTWLIGTKGRDVILEFNEGLDNPLWVCHKAPEILRFLKAEACGELAVQNKQELLEKMLLKICEVHPEIPYERTLQELIEREKLFSTALGKGVAVPHAYAPELQEPLISLTVLENGIDFGGDDEIPVRLIFMLLGPNNPGQHLNLLGEIARVCEDESTLERIQNAQNDDERLRLLSWSQIG